jgi:membrane-bound metal-dependent hydrolase YbcI (DUF457 family)
MNYVHHAIIGVGTAALGVLAAEALGAPQVTPVTLGLGALAAAAGSIATDLDHPKSFISNTIPSRILRVTLAVLAIPLLAALGTYLTTRDLYGTLTSVTTLIWGINFLRWTALALFTALGLMLLSLLLYKSLHHRGPLHSLLFSAGVTLAACAVFGIFGASWTWGLPFGWGWLWHILADGLTDQGVPFHWPFNDHRKHTLPGWLCGAGRILLTLTAIGGMIGLVISHLRPYFV